MRQKRALRALAAGLALGVAAVAPGHAAATTTVADATQIYASGPWHPGGKVILRRGDRYWYCTAGPQYYQPDNTVVMAIAGHCFTKYGYGDGYYGDNGHWEPADVTISTVTDLALIRLGGDGAAAASGQILSNSGLRQVGGRAQLEVGMLVCLHGATSGDACGTLDYYGPQPADYGTPGAVNMWHIHITWGRVGGGDSGSPVYDPNWTLVAGLLNAGDLDGDHYAVWFYPTEAVEQAFGTSLRPVT